MVGVASKSAANGRALVFVYLNGVGECVPPSGFVGVGGGGVGCLSRGNKETQVAEWERRVHGRWEG